MGAYIGRQEMARKINKGTSHKGTWHDTNLLDD